jgi:hypothetical protein
MASEFEDLREQIAAAAEHVGRFEVPVGEAADTGVAFATQPAVLEPEVARVVAKGLRASLLLAEASMGECQEDTPYSPMRPVGKRDEDKIVWCCNHDPQHCKGCC